MHLETCICNSLLNPCMINSLLQGGKEPLRIAYIKKRVVGQQSHMSRVGF